MNSQPAVTKPPVGAIATGIVLSDVAGNGFQDSADRAKMLATLTELRSAR